MVWGLGNGLQMYIPYDTMREHFFEFKEVQSRQVYLGNNQMCEVKDIGIVRLKLHDNLVKILTDVRYIPDSLGALDRLGYTSKISSGEMKIYKGSLLKLKGKLKNGLYVICE